MADIIAAALEAAERIKALLPICSPEQLEEIIRQLVAMLGK